MNLKIFEGKPIEKLVEVIAAGVGTLYNPTRIRREADAESYRIQKIAEAEALAKRIGQEIDFDTLERMETRQFVKGLSRQRNIDRITEVAAEQINQHESVSSEPVNDDWTTRFFNIAQDVNNEEMQKLWGRILAGEVKQPNSFSLRTLEIVRNLSQEDANIFMKFGALAIDTQSNISFVIRGSNSEYLNEAFEIPFEWRLTMEESGLMLSNDLNYFIDSEPDKTGRTGLIYAGHYLIVDKGQGTLTNSVPILKFTSAGMQLLKLLEPAEFNLKYATKLAEYLKMDHVKLSYTKIVSYNEQGIGLYQRDKVFDITQK